MSPAESETAFSAVAVAGEHAELAWEFAKNHLDELRAQNNEKLWSDLLPKIAEGFNASGCADELVQLTRAQGSAESLVKAKAAADQLRFRAKLKDQLVPDVDDWVLKKLDGRVQAAANEQ
jgi:hypothetical protein